MSFSAGFEKTALSKEDLKEMIEEHEKLIQVLQSPSHKDDLQETKKQKRELAQYKRQLKERS